MRWPIRCSHPAIISISLSVGTFAYWTEDLHFVGRLLVAILLTGALGWERNRAGKSAGVRTHMIVGMGAAFFAILPELFIDRYRSFGGGIQFDPVRVIQAVVAGISFVGAGTVFVSKSGDYVKGLTTAASIWTSTAVGMCSGVGRFALATSATALLLIVLHLVKWIEEDDGEGRKFEVGDQSSLTGQISEKDSAGQSAKKRSNPGAT